MLYYEVTDAHYTEYVSANVGFLSLLNTNDAFKKYGKYLITKNNSTKKQNFKTEMTVFCYEI